eukprot:IDg14357t1
MTETEPRAREGASNVVSNYQAGPYAASTPIILIDLEAEAMAKEVGNDDERLYFSSATRNNLMDLIFFFLEELPSQNGCSSRFRQL